jgi:NAD(P)H-dependent flavin oxidoreductase YrpB (nitropropane dioxygenase family)
VPVISFFWGKSSTLVFRAKADGAIVMQTVSSAEEAKAAVQCGVDIVIAQDWEAGGHGAGVVGRSRASAGHCCWWNSRWSQLFVGEARPQ